MEAQRILFVCRENKGRSQAAEAIANLLGVCKAESAGTEVDIPEWNVGAWPETALTIDVMQATYGIDISQNTRRQATPEMLGEYGRIIVMAEWPAVPDWLRKYPHTRWHIQDLKEVSRSETIQIIDDIHQQVAQLAT